MSTIHFIGGEKGGVGKSLVARVLAQYLIDHALPFLGFDADRSHGALLRFYADFASPVVVDDGNSLDAVVEAAAAEPGRRVLVDLAAQTHAPLVRWIDDTGALALARELGIGIRYWHVMDAGRDSVDLLRALFDRFGDRLDYVLVLNPLRGDDFSLFERAGMAARAESLGAQVLRFPRLHDAVMHKIDARSASFWAAAHGNDDAGAGLGMLERSRVKVWLGKAYAELARAPL